MKSDFSFPRSARLTTKADYATVFDEQLKVSQSWFLALYRKNQQAHSRLGLIVSKRILKKAPARNYLKRILREGFRLNRAAIPGLDLVILARKGLKLTDKVKLKKELDTLWQQLTSV